MNSAAHSPSSLIDLTHVQKSYDGKTLVIKDLNLSIAKGEFLTLLGASGSGKTTTLMMLAGFETPTRGEIRMAGKPIQNVPAHKRGMGMVFQNYALFPHMTVSENLAYPLKMRGLDRSTIETKVKRAIDMVQLHDMQLRRPSELSGGQQQRVALARAMVFEPQVILMDEPLGALDKNLREHMQYEIKQLHRSLGVTVVYVTHDQGEALTMSDRVAVFHQGDIAQIGAPTTLYEHPENAYVATFIGENNVLHGQLKGRQGEQVDVALNAGLNTRGVAVGALGATGQDIQLLIRPEKVRLCAIGPSSYQATLADRVYLGDHIRVHLKLSNGDTLIVKTANDQSINALRNGQPVGFTWNPEDARVFTAR
ncbi:MAG: ABC transporter ATP-binding protein [Pseudomonas sp.]|uniref:ABC transporter ATP-binding protein n=1 Tax=Pseudomonas sp. TaxID=306 RepID=UPI0030F2F8FF